MLDTFIGYVLLHPTIPFKSFLTSEGNFGEYGELYVILKFSGYLYLYGYLCGKIFKFLNESVKEKKKKEILTQIALQYFLWAQAYKYLGITYAVILTIVTIY
jgi:hypothetical protein